MNRYKRITILSIIGCLFVGIVASCSSQQAASCFQQIALQRMKGFPAEESGMELGVSACYAGAVDGQLLLAGGCNFPKVAAVDGGKKRFYQGVYAADANTDSVLAWRKVGQLPVTAAYGASIVTPQGLICVGGNNESGALASVYRLSLSANGQTIQIDTLPSLPFAMDNLGGALVEQTIYVAGGNVGGKPSNIMLALNLSHPEDGWQLLTDFPGAPRVQPVCVSQQKEGKAMFYLWGGFAGASDNRSGTLSTDGYCYSPATQEWLAISPPVGADSITISLGGGMGIAFTDSLILCAGGVNKEIFLSALQREEQIKGALKAGKQELVDSLKAAGRAYMLWPAAQYRFNDRLLMYNTRLDSWTEVKQSPLFARAGAVLAGWEDTFFTINGELKPGIRTPDITKFTINP